MKNLAVLLCFCLLVPLLSSFGITAPDRQVFAICIAIDLQEEDKFVLTVQAPQGKPVSGEPSDPSNGAAGYMIFGTVSNNLAHALHLLDTTLPFPITFCQLRLCFISTDVLTHHSLTSLTLDLFRFPSIRASANLVVVQGSAMEALKAQQSSFSMRLSTHIDTLLEHLVSNGYLPLSTLSICMQYLGSGRRDPLVGLGAVNPLIQSTGDSGGGGSTPGGGGSGSGGGTSSGGDATKESSQSVFSRSYPVLEPTDIAGVTITQGGDPVEMMGAAVLNDGYMVGMLSPRECVIFHHLKSNGRLRCVIQGESLTLQILLKPEDINDTVLAEGDALVRKLQALGSDPFGFGNVSAHSFLTNGDWEAYGFHQRYPTAEVYVGS